MELIEAHIGKIFGAIVIAFLTWIGKQIFSYLRTIHKENSLLGFVHGNLLLSCNWTLETIEKNKDSMPLIEKICREDKDYQPFIVNSNPNPISFTFLKEELCFADEKLMSELIKYSNIQEIVNQFDVDFRSDFFKTLSPDRKIKAINEYLDHTNELARFSISSYIALSKFMNTGFRVYLVQKRFRDKLKENAKKFAEELDNLKEDGP